MRRARTTTGTGVLCARYMCPRAVEATGACAARSGCHKLRTMPGAALQRRPAGARRRRGRQPSGLRDARPRCEPDGGHSAPARCGMPALDACSLARTDSTCELNILALRAACVGFVLPFSTGNIRRAMPLLFPSKRESHSPLCPLSLRRRKR